MQLKLSGLSPLHVAFETDACKEFADIATYSEFAYQEDSMGSCEERSMLYAMSSLETPNEFAIESADAEDSIQISRESFQSEDLNLPYLEKDESSEDPFLTHDQSTLSSCDHSSISQASSSDSDRILDSSELLHIFEVQETCKRIDKCQCIDDAPEPDLAAPGTSAWDRTRPGPIHTFANSHCTCITQGSGPATQQSASMPDALNIDPAVAVKRNKKFASLPRRQPPDTIPMDTTETHEKKPKNRHPAAALAVLDEYFKAHIDFPYPSRAEQRELARRAGISLAMLKQ
jgi:hypothetical protein